MTWYDVRGIFFGPGQAVAVAAGLRPAVVRLAPDPQPVEGLAVLSTGDGGR
jgi:hypothetical protein